jgi:multiple sugar transport system permease protein
MDTFANHPLQGAKRTTPKIYLGMREQAILKKMFLYLVIFCLLTVALLPFIWVASMSLQTREQMRIRIPIQWIPNPITIQNYIDGWKAQPWLYYFRNNLIWGLGSTTGLVLSTTLVAYAFARMKFRGRSFLILLNICLMLLPDQVTMVPRFIIYSWLGWVGTFKPVIIPAFLAYAPSHTFMLTQFFKTIPNELSEAARIDGASELTILRTIILPLSKPILVVMIAFHLTWVWNDYLTPLLYLKDKQYMVIVLGLQQFIGVRGQVGWGPLMAMSLALAIPVIALYFYIQKYVTQAFVLSGMKG